MKIIFTIGIALLFFGTVCDAATIIGGDSIGPDNTLTNNLGGFAAMQSGGDVYGQPAIEFAQSGSSLLRELRVIVHGSPSNDTQALRFDDFKYVANFWRKADYLGGEDAAFKVNLGDPSNVTLVLGEGNTVIPSVVFGNAASIESGDENPSYDFRFDLSQAVLPGQSTPYFTSPLAADTWIIAFQSEHELSSGNLLVSFSSSTAGNDPYFHKAFNGFEQHPRGILFNQDPIEFRWGMNLSERSLYADYDEDNDVDGYDFFKWQRGESPDPWSAGDLALWEQQFGMMANLTALVVVIPEPSSISLVSLCFVMRLLQRRKNATCPNY